MMFLLFYKMFIAVFKKKVMRFVERISKEQLFYKPLITFWNTAVNIYVEAS